MCLCVHVHCTLGQNPPSLSTLSLAQAREHKGGFEAAPTDPASSPCFLFFRFDRQTWTPFLSIRACYTEKDTTFPSLFIHIWRPLCSHDTASDCQSHLFTQMYIYLVPLSAEENLTHQLTSGEAKEKSLDVADINI